MKTKKKVGVIKKSFPTVRINIAIKTSHKQKLLREIKTTALTQSEIVRAALDLYFAAKKTA